MSNKANISQQTMKTVLSGFLALAALTTPAVGQGIQTVLQYSGAQSVGIAIDPADNYYYTFWMNDPMSGAGSADPIIVYSPYVNGVRRVLETPNSPLISPSGVVMARGGLVVADLGIPQLQWADTWCSVVSNLNNAQFIAPSAVAADASGNLFVTDADGVYQMDSFGGVTALGSGFNQPGGIAVDSAGQVWVADTFSDTIKVIQADGTVKVVAGKLNTPGSLPQGIGSVLASNARFNSPGALYWAGGGTGLLVADYWNNAIRNVFYDSVCGCYRVGTIATGLNGPVGIAIDNEGYIIVADSKSGAIRSISRDAQPAPVITPASGAFSNAVTATFSTPLLGSYSSVIRYTINGSTPTPLSSAGKSVTFDGGIWGDIMRPVLIRCFSPDLLTSATVSNAYSFFVAPPVCDPPGMVSSNSVLVTLKTPTEGATLYWTIDGSEPAPTNGFLYAGPFVLGTNGTLKVKGFKPHYADSTTTSANFALSVATPVITPPGSTNSSDLTVNISSATAGAQLYYTLDGSDPSQTNGRLYTADVVVRSNCVLKAKGYRQGFVESSVTSAIFNLFVAAPSISPSGASNSNPVEVTASTTTPGASLYWTLDGSVPTTASNLCTNGVPFTVDRSGTLTVKAFKDGYTASTPVSASFNLYVEPPQVFPGSTRSINSLTVNASEPTAGAEMHYTTDGSTPGSSSPIYTGALTISNNTIVKIIGIRDGFAASQVVSNGYEIQVDAPIMTPPGGYFPDGQVISLTVERPDALIYYTLDGREPTQEDTLYTGPFRVNQTVMSGDLRMVKARAFAPNTLPSAIISGQSVSTNSVGVGRDVVAGPGSTIVLPIVANLATTQTVRSLQFRLEVVPSSPGAPAIAEFMQPLDFSTNDFIPSGIGSLNGSSVTNWLTPYINGYTNGIQFRSTLANMLLRDVGMIANLKIEIPRTAVEGDKYTLNVLEVSGTSDAGQKIVSITALPARTLTIKSVPYLAGDVAVGGWYNAGDFGDGNLDNADVNLVIKASMGVGTPYEFSDAFNAMDVYPEGPGLIGDGLISFLDWQHIYLRSLRLETNNWIRYWGPDGVLSHRPVNALPPSSLRSGAAVAGAINTNLWLRQACVSVGDIGNLAPGAQCSMPVYVSVLPGFSVAGLQFRAVVEPSDGAPAVSSVEFIRSGGVAAPMPVRLDSSNHVACAWPIGSFSKALQGYNLLGWLNFQIPADAVAGQSYKARLLFPDGAADYNTGLSMESMTGVARVLQAPAASSRMSDEWKTNFFGLTPGPESYPDADPDHDGIPNWQEYLAGTNPTNVLSRLEFNRPQLNSNQVTLNWAVIPGRVYIIERSTTLEGRGWTPVSTNTFDCPNPGAFAGSSLTETPCFYRIRLQQP